MSRCACLMVSLVCATSPAMGFDQAIEQLLPRVVKLYGLKAGAQAGYGTGVFVSADGLILTVNSLLIDARRVRVAGADGVLRDAEVVRRDNERQLALIRLSPPAADTKFAANPFFELACDKAGESSLRPGDWVVVAGNPFKVAEGAEPVSLAHGVFSARTRLDARRANKEFPYHGDVLIIDAITSNPGAPGSAVVDLDGRFVGLIGREVTSNLTHTHLNYAIPRDVLCEFLNDDGTKSKPAEAEASVAQDWGIRLTRMGYQKLPAMVERVRRGSIAERAGIRPDDVILSVNGTNVSDPDEYDKRLALMRPGEALDLVVRRGRAIVPIRLEPEKPR